MISPKLMRKLPMLLTGHTAFMGLPAYAQDTGGSAGLGAVIFFALVLLYFAPTIIAYNTSHKQAAAIAILNLLLGWTLLGWVVALVWSFVKSSEPPASPISVKASAAPPPRLTFEEAEVSITKLMGLRDKGLIDEAEFAAKKAEILKLIA